MFYKLHLLENVTLIHSTYCHVYHINLSYSLHRISAKTNKKEDDKCDIDEAIESSLK